MSNQQCPPVIPDELNPDFMFQMTDQALLLQVAKDELDPVVLVKKELAARGVDSNGAWIGFQAAREYWEKAEFRNGKEI